ncbi:ubiquinol-cytochrome c reductase, cytochrome b [Burkholderiales bacterium GJ-E10]|nr:ubiquinol-cytochrome c reductase, cytochrome b [Burkholderiales bacterium GJ-E10]
MGLHTPRYKGLLGWVDARMPSIMDIFETHVAGYYAPKNFNFWYFFGSIAAVVLVIQLVSGAFLAMHYKPDSRLAFWSVELIMREVQGGWLIRYMHSVGASFFFIVIYFHIFRAMLYGSYRTPREIVWIAGCVLFLALMAESFFGYLLPWGQMSFWGAQVIINLFSSIPVIGPDLSTWIRGDFVIGDATLNRFFALHTMVMPTVMIGLIVAHVMALHDVGSNNPDGIEIKEHLGDDGKPLDGIPFHPYYTVHDIYGIAFFFIIYFAVVFFAPEMGGVFLEGNNFIPADPMQTPLHIAPLWYFTPFYTILRATTADFLPWLGGAVLALGALTYFTVRGWRVRLFVAALTALAFAFATVHKVQLDAKLWGVILMAVSVTILFALPWLDRSPVKSMRYRPTWHRVLLFVFIAAFLVLGYFGMQEPNPMRNLISQFCMAIYFGFFALMPWWSRMGTFKPAPDRVRFTAH